MSFRMNLQKTDLVKLFQNMNKNSVLKRLVLFLTTMFCVINLVGCDSNKKSKDDRMGMSPLLYSDYITTLDEVEQLEIELLGLSQNCSITSVQSVMESVEELDFDSGGEDLSEEAEIACSQLSQRINRLKQEVDKSVRKIVVDSYLDIKRTTDLLIERATSFPMYLMRGDKIQCDVSSDNLFKLRVYNADSENLVKNFGEATSFREEMEIKNTGIYLVEISPKKIRQYIDVNIKLKMENVENIMSRKKVKSDTVLCGKGEFMAFEVNGVKMENVYDEPKKLTLRSQLKSSFSGSSRTMLFIPVDADTKDVLYRLRISTSHQDVQKDGKFLKEADRKYHQIKFLGLPIYESNRNGSNLFREILLATKPDREEEAYCNMFVFKTRGQAKKFQDNATTNKLDYDIDRSSVGTQSCNGRISVMGVKTLYMGFENSQVTSNVYLWLEVLKVKTVTEFYRVKYSI